MKEFAPETPRPLSALISTVHFCSAVNPGITKDTIFVKKKKSKNRHLLAFHTSAGQQDLPSCLHLERVATATPGKNTFQKNQVLITEGHSSGGPDPEGQRQEARPPSTDASAPQSLAVGVESVC